MSSKNYYEQTAPYVQRINLSNMRTRRKPQKLCQIEEIGPIKADPHIVMMSSKNYGQEMSGTPPHVKEMRLDDKPPKTCPETSDSAKIFSSKVTKIEEVIDSFHDMPIKQNKINKFSIFNAKFTLNNVFCELEYVLSKFT